MIRTWACVGWLTALLALTALGCRTQPPNTKPPPSPEVLTSPPQEARFNTSVYPKQAFQENDILKKKILEGEASPIMPARGMGMTPSMGPGPR
jgi:hypothetical protein